MSKPATFSEKRKERKTKRFWITLSLLLSTALLVWSFSLPFRQPGQPIVSSSPSQQAGEGQLDLSEQIQQRRTNAEEFRDAAIALDREFMRAVAERNRPKRDLPGHQDSKAAFERHVESVKKQLRQFKDAKEGTVEWEAKQQLLASLQDAPRE